MSVGLNCRKYFTSHSFITKNENASRRMTSVYALQLAVNEGTPPGGSSHDSLLSSNSPHESPALSSDTDGVALGVAAAGGHDKHLKAQKSPKLLRSASAKLHKTLTDLRRHHFNFRSLRRSKKRSAGPVASTSAASSGAASGATGEMMK